MAAPRFSVVIPARNEEFYLPKCLDALKQSQLHASTTVEVIVVINRSTDKTEAIARERGALIIANDSKNLAQIRNAGIRAASGQIIITVDADSQMTENMLTEIDRHMSSGQVIGGGVMIVPERLSIGILLTGLCLVPIALRHRISGGLFYFTREVFDAISGFNEALSSVEDIDFAVRLRRYGKTTNRRFINLFRAYIITSCRKFDHFGDWYFILRPWKIYSLLKGRNQSLADLLWYDFER